MTTSVVPGFYRFFFTWFDLIVAIHAAYNDFVDQEWVMSSLVPKELRSEGVDRNYRFIFQQAGGGMLGIALLSGGLLRATNDLKIWRYIQAATLLVDFAFVYSAWDAFRVQDRLEPASWRGEDWGTVVIIALVTSLRVAFLAGVGFKKTHTDKAH
jgi:hypothetical protein